jgi:hypothetical protein
VSVRLCGCVVVVTVAVSSPGPCPPAPGLARQDPRARGFRFVPVCSRRSLRLTTTIHSLRNTAVPTSYGRPWLPVPDETKAIRCYESAGGGKDECGTGAPRVQPDVEVACMLLLFCGMILNTH